MSAKKMIDPEIPILFNHSNSSNQPFVINLRLKKLAKKCFANVFEHSVIKRLQVSGVKNFKLFAKSATRY